MSLSESSRLRLNPVLISRAFARGSVAGPPFADTYRAGLPGLSEHWTKSSLCSWLVGPAIHSMTSATNRNGHPSNRSRSQAPLVATGFLERPTTLDDGLAGHQNPSRA